MDELIKQLRAMKIDVIQFTEWHIRVGGRIDFFFGKNDCSWWDMLLDERGKKPADQIIFFVKHRLEMKGARNMERKAVTSHVMISIGYDPATKTLQVEFPKRQKDNVRPVYDYHDVPQEKYDELMGKGKSEGEKHSIGSYFLRMIKPNYKFTRVEERREEETKASGASSPETE